MARYRTRMPCAIRSPVFWFARVLFPYRSAGRGRVRRRTRRGRTRRHRSTATPLSLRFGQPVELFLWSSMPDEELLKHAALGDLTRPDVLAAQTRRMLKDPRSRVWPLSSRRTGSIRATSKLTILWTASASRTSITILGSHVRGADPVFRRRDQEQPFRSRHAVWRTTPFVNPVLAKHYGMNDIPQFTLAEVKPVPVPSRTARRSMRG